MVPIAIGVSIGMLLCKSGTSKIGYYTPLKLCSSTLLPIFAGLITTLGVDTSFNRSLSIVLFARQLGLAVSIAIVQVIFTCKLSSNLARVVPGLDPAAVESTGLLKIVEYAPAPRHGDVLEDADMSFGETWYLAVGLTCATLLGSLLMEWRSVK
ncbi:hypothetical protein N7457_006288 [Penicillium paradoxum]|uniref:uncharacterized protein n=1 Tax=Penicillium paradoxum TaxID=176176 RepID=UPI00254891DB|nr:uncharacterized protein N7457_006288 [Penicillium paradoxum]KAJ5781128.1 hypothetical protein N7457_006288 [Penicillium paradoxum]